MLLFLYMIYRTEWQVIRAADLKLFNLRKQKDQPILNYQAKRSTNTIIHNISSCSLTKKEVEALSYEID